MKEESKTSYFATCYTLPQCYTTYQQNCREWSEDLDYTDESIPSMTATNHTLPVNYPHFQRLSNTSVSFAASHNLSPPCLLLD